MLFTEPVQWIYTLSHELQRLAALRACAILDTDTHPAFDCLTRAAALAFDTPIALVALVDSDRQWFKSAFGIDERETARSISFCSHTIEGYEPLVVPDATRDPRFVRSPLVTGAPHVRFYAGAPLIEANGYAIGTVSVLDTQPRSFSDCNIRLLGHMADAVMHAIDAHRDRLELKELRRRLASQDAGRSANAEASLIPVRPQQTP
ncbi:diguanylate cyclase [Glycocaulis alkaliphilus]|uniref:Diguanylate cyclase n=1 Tax=Glycocaulis alkaliphilus TaxID=1434191 RepID=A0A3T0E5K4_9PROT|nr:diguanylate cyclase [Glycocaulis alkaliphilus]